MKRSNLLEGIPGCNVVGQHRFRGLVFVEVSNAPCESEICDFDVALRVEEKVCWLDVAVEKLAAVWVVA